MEREQNNQEKTERQELLKRLRETPELYVLMSVCTKAPYVVCDEETFDDEATIFFKQEDAQVAAKRLAEEKIPVGVAKMENKHLLLFYTTLCTMGINAILVCEGETKERVQLNEFVKHADPEKLKEEGKVWVENPALYLTMMYYMQESRKQPKPDESNPRLRELQEEIAANFGKGRYITAVKNDKGIVLLKLGNGDLYQAMFTDILEFQRFKKDQDLRPAIVRASRIPELLPKEAAGIILNPMGINLPLAIKKTERKPEGQAETAEAENGETENSKESEE